MVKGVAASIITVAVLALGACSTAVSLDSPENASTNTSGTSSNSGGTSSNSSGTNSNSNCPKISVKYRTKGTVPICANTFSGLPSPNGDVRGAYFDSGNNYMIVNLNGTNYHYCRFPNNVWREWSNQSNKYTYYDRNIRGGYDCRDGGGRYVPDY